MPGAEAASGVSWGSALQPPPPKRSGDDHAAGPATTSWPPGSPTWDSQRFTSPVQEVDCKCTWAVLQWHRYSTLERWGHRNHLSIYIYLSSCCLSRYYHLSIYIWYLSSTCFSLSSVYLYLFLLIFLYLLSIKSVCPPLSIGSPTYHLSTYLYFSSVCHGLLTRANLPEKVRPVKGCIWKKTLSGNFNLNHSSRKFNFKKFLYNMCTLPIWHLISTFYNTEGDVVSIKKKKASTLQCNSIV